MIRQKCADCVFCIPDQEEPYMLVCCLMAHTPCTDVWECKGFKSEKAELGVVE